MNTNTLSPEEVETQKSYKKIAESRNNTHANPDFWKTEFGEFRKLIPSGKIIDVGCGAGRDALLFTRNGYEYVGIDLSKEMLAQAKNLVPVADFQQMDMYDLDFPEQTFDGFWAAASLLHIPKQKVSLALSQIRKVVKPGGTGFIAVKEGAGERVIQGSFEEDKRFFAFYGNEEFVNILKENGFEVLKHSRATFDYNPPKNLTVWLVYFVKIL